MLPGTSVSRLPSLAPGILAESAPNAIGPITLGVKRAGKRSAGKPHAAFDEADAGNGVTGRNEAPAAGRKPPANSDSLSPTTTAPVSDPTDEGGLGSDAMVHRHRQTKGPETANLRLWWNKPGRYSTVRPSVPPRLPQGGPVYAPIRPVTWTRLPARVARSGTTRQASLLGVRRRSSIFLSHLGACFFAHTSLT